MGLTIHCQLATAGDEAHTLSDGCAAISCAKSCENLVASCSVTKSFFTGILFRMFSAFA